jgi:hypothetical protein
MPTIFRSLFLIFLLSISTLSAQTVSTLSGTGVSTDPFLINTVEELKFFRNQINVHNATYDNAGIYFKLVQDIDLSAETADWTPIGTSSNVNFMGNFDGNGKKIKGLRIGTTTTASTATVTGLFGVCMVGTISNLILENVSINISTSGTSDVAIGVLSANAQNFRIANCVTQGAVNVNYTGTGNLYIGGLSAKVEGNSDVFNSFSNVNIVSTNAFSTAKDARTSTVGGIAGNNTVLAGGIPRIRNCFALGNIDATATSNGMVCAGGVAGSNAGTIENCYAKGNVIATTQNGTVKAGGVVGTKPSSGSVSNSFAFNSLVSGISPLGVRIVNRIGEMLGTGNVLNNYAKETLVMKSGTSQTAIDATNFTVQFDSNGGSTSPENQTLKFGSAITLPVNPIKGDSIFAGWFNSQGVSFTNQTPITENVILKAKWWLAPKQYIALSSSDGRYNSALIKSTFGSPLGKTVAVATQPLFRVFERNLTSTFVPSMKRHLAEAEQYDVPIMIFLSVLPFNNVRPDLYNWWDASAAGYNADNVNHVEWYGWDASTAVKIGWLNWGQQLRLPPMPNIMSAKFQQAESEAITTLMTIVKEWYDKLPENKKYLFAGIRSTDEMAIGVNNWYYPNGNSYVGQSTTNDPKTGIDPYNLPSRGVQTIGYNAVKTAGIKSSGTITIEDINEVCRRHGEFLSKIYYDLGFPRDKIFTSSFAKSLGEAKTCVNDYSCPSWSFYHSEATNPSSFTEAMEVIKTSTAPGWSMAEWGIGGSSATDYYNGLKTSLALSGNRLIRITGNKVIDGNGNLMQGPADGIKMLYPEMVGNPHQGATLGAQNPLTLLNSYAQSSTNTAPAGFTWLSWEVISGINDGLPTLKSLNVNTSVGFPIDNKLDIKVYSGNGKLIIKGCDEAKEIRIFTTLGNIVYAGHIQGKTIELSMQKGIYIIPGYGKVIVK